MKKESAISANNILINCYKRKPSFIHIKTDFISVRVTPQRLEGQDHSRWDRERPQP